MTTPAMTSDCSNCEGTGVVGDASYWNPEAAWSDNCPACDGRGTVPDPVAVGDAAVAAAGIRALIHADSGRLDNWSHQ